MGTNNVSPLDKSIFPDGLNTTQLINTFVSPSAPTSGIFNDSVIHDDLSSALIPTLDPFNVTSTFFQATGNLSLADEGYLLSNSSNNGTTSKSLAEIISISIVVTILSILTVLGNLLVIIAFKVDKQLQTISNYFLLSLAIADISIGLVSMPLYTVYLLMGYWPLGPLLCDLWLSLDYLMSNASAANLMLISFDRYLSVTRPLTYRAKRTSKKVGIMIGLAWIISLLLWPPWIFAWPHIEGKRTVPETDCYIQFLYTNAYVTIGTHVLAFWIPVMIMCVLYFKIYRETEKRQKRMPMLQASKDIKGFKRRVPSMDCEQELRNRSSEDFDDVYDLVDSLVSEDRSFWSRCSCCKIDRDYEGDDSSSSDPASPVAESFSDPQNLQDSSFHRNSGNWKPKSNSHKHSNGTKSSKHRHSGGLVIPLIAFETARASQVVTSPSSLTGTSSRSTELSSVANDCSSPLLEDTDEMYTIMIKFPNSDLAESSTTPSIQMIASTEEDNQNHRHKSKRSGYRRSDSAPVGSLQCDDINFASTSRDNTLPPPKGTPALGRRTRYTDANRTAQHAKIAAQVAYKVKQQRARKKRTERRQDKKAAKTLSAILLAFIVTWLPYHIVTLVEAFCTGCVPSILYNFAYWFCYINSTVNPVCYALCNANFRRTFWKILTCTCTSKSNMHRNQMTSMYSFGNANR